MFPSPRHRFIPTGISNRYELVRNIQEQISEVLGRRAIGLARTEIERLQVQVIVVFSGVGWDNFWYQSQWLLGSVDIFGV
ncbi:hypothetical protein RHGRI_010281 [Rhododendron griersonianum]|uniref:Uncharacterized protein n=1 Tax=Rhododendron griersonianum TaxID=479676 RepID=A0AAV6KIJ0_9ERIC|nr:hypothetical protein RHGRI_010281 [Rhododendron griersonianum]